MPETLIGDVARSTSETKKIHVTNFVRVTDDQSSVMRFAKMRLQ
jgi:hypothetical protein